MGKWLEAAQDAEKAAEGFTPATMDQLKVPSFYQLTEGNWIWGYDMTLEVAKIFPYATPSSWVRSFSGLGYAPATQVYACINNLLYDKIPATDVRKNWWVNEDLYSPILDEIVWPYEGTDYTGLGLANLEISDVKMAFLPYTNVKFGMNTIGSENNDEDWPLMRVEGPSPSVPSGQSLRTSDSATRPFFLMMFPATLMSDAKPMSEYT